MPVLSEAMYKQGNPSLNGIFLELVEISEQSEKDKYCMISLNRWTLKRTEKKVVWNGGYRIWGNRRDVI